MDSGTDIYLAKQQWIKRENKKEWKWSIPLKWDEIKSTGKRQFNLPVISDISKMENIFLDLNSGALISCQNLRNYGFMVGLTK